MKKKICNLSTGGFSKSKFISLVILVICCCTGVTSWAQIVVDGNPSDWPAVLNNPANTTKVFRHDAFNMNGVDDSWAQGSQDNDAHPNTDWHWVYGNSNDKGDIGNAGAVLIGSKLYFFGDRYAQNGTAEIGFWFFVGD